MVAMRSSVIAASLAAMLALTASSAPSAAGVQGRIVRELSGALAGDRFGSTIAAGGDFNGDGWPDLAVGAPSAPGGSGGGIAYLYFGGAPFDTIADLRLGPGAARAAFGQSLAWAGDFNGDGVGDLIVGSPSEKTGLAASGRARIYFGGVRPDSIADLVLGPFRTGEGFGTSVAGIGDVNGDGYDDVIAGAPADSVQMGHAYVFFGGAIPDGVPDLVLTGSVAYGKFGFSVGAAGDVDHDGFVDVMVGEPDGSGLQVRSGRVQIYRGGPGMDAAADFVLSGSITYAGLGYSVARAGDVNGDGYDDLIASEYGDNQAQLFLGGSAFDVIRDLAYPIGRVVTAAADVDDDGFADVVTSTATGEAVLFLGARTLDAGYDLVFVPPVPDRYSSVIAAAAQRINGIDGGELLFGCPGRSGTANANGRVYLVAVDRVRLIAPNGGERWFAGDPQTVSWLAAGPADIALSLDGGATWRTVASDVAPLGGSMTVAAPDTVADQARVRVSLSGRPPSGRDASASQEPFQIAACDLTAPDGGESWVLGSTEAVRWHGRLPADVSLSTDDGRSWTTLARGVGGSADNALAVVAPAAPTEFARVRVRAAYLPLSPLASDASQGRFRIVLYRLLSPNGGEMWDAGARDTVRWRGATRADLAISMDEGATWITLATNVGGADENTEVIAVPQLSAARARVRVSATGVPPLAGSFDVSDGSFHVLDPLPGAAITMRTLISPIHTGPGASFGFSVASAGDFNGDGYGDVIAGAPKYDLASGTDVGEARIFFGGPAAANTPALVLQTYIGGASLGVSVASAGDLNGDGYDDVIVGAPNYGVHYGQFFGRAIVYFGGASPDPLPDLWVSGTATRTAMGRSVACAGDVNGDGYPDFVVGNTTSGAEPNTVQVYFGGRRPDATPDWELAGPPDAINFGECVTSAGDLNADGYDDVAVGAPGFDSNAVGQVYVFYGGPRRDSSADLVLRGTPGDRFGEWIAPAGDWNGDGHADLLVGGRYNDLAGADAGAVFLYFGGSSPHSNPDLVFTGEAAGDEFGCSFAGAGDVNLDGFDDVIVGAFRNDRPAYDAGRAYVFFGRPQSDRTPGVTLNGDRALDNYGVGVASAGDFDGDGLPDLIVGAQGSDAGASNGGRAYVYAVKHDQIVSPNGGETWIAGEPDTIRWRGEGPAAVALSADGGVTWATLASGVGGAAVNALPIITPPTATIAARVRVSPSGQPVLRVVSDQSDGDFRIATPAIHGRAVVLARDDVRGSNAGEEAGLALARAGDVNGDGFPDYLVGARGGTAPGAVPDRVRLMFGGPVPRAPVSLDVPAGAAPLGVSLAAAGDINRDGFADVIVGSPGDAAGGAETGRAFVFFGGPLRGGAPDLTLAGPSAGAQFGAAVAGAGDVNGDGYDDLIVGAPFDDANGAGAGRVYLYQGGPAPDAGADLQLTGVRPGDHFGASLAGGGDLNGDHFSDFVVGAPGSDTPAIDAGRAYVFAGAPKPSGNPSLVLTGASASDQFGYTMAIAGDVNGDGFDDVLVGAPFNGARGPQSGRVYLFEGGVALNRDADLILTGAARGEFFGLALAGLGDLNRDGFADFAVGAPFSPAAGADAGRVDVHFGALLPGVRADLVWTGAAAGDRLGWSIAGPGDLGRDGFDDAIAGAPFADRGVTDAGATYVYDARRYVLLNPRSAERWDVGGTQTIRWLGAEPADLWLGGGAGAGWRMLAHAVGGADSNAIAIRVPRAAGDSVRVRITPANAQVPGAVASDSLLSIRAAIALLDFSVTPGPQGVALAWSTDPAAGASGLAGYRLYRVGRDGAAVERLGAPLITANRVQVAETERGATYVLVAVNGLGEESELGRSQLPAPAAGISAWPIPLPEGGSLTFALALPAAPGGYTPADLSVGVYDVQGRRVADLLGGATPTDLGVVTWRWDVTSPRRSPLAPGMYFVRASVPSLRFHAERKIVVVR